MGRFGTFSDLIPPLSGVESRRGFREYDLFEFSRTVPNRIKGSEKASTSRQLLKAAFGRSLPEILERQDESGTPGGIMTDHGLHQILLGLVSQAGDTGLLDESELKRVKERYLATPGARIRGRFRALAMFLVWHTFYIEGRDPFEAA